MLSPDQIRQKAERRYPSILKEMWDSSYAASFPWDIAFGRPNPTDHLPTVAKEFDLLVGGSQSAIGYGYIVETERKNTRLGTQTFPISVYFPDEANFLRFINKTAEVESLRSAVAETAAKVPEIVPWVHTHPARVLENRAEWSDIMTLARCLIDRPKPGCFPRELPVEVSGKLLGLKQNLIRELLYEIPGAVDLTVAEPLLALGLKTPEPLIELRFLTQQCAQKNGLPFQYAAIPVASLARFSPAVANVFIIENRMSFLSFPSVADSIAIWGQGNSASLLASAGWIADRQVYYAGDIDATGFLILNRLRKHFPSAQSLLMDATTYTRAIQLSLLTKAPDIALPSFDRLSESERIIANRVHERREQLEQEKFPMSWLVEQLGANGFTISP